MSRPIASLFLLLVTSISLSAQEAFNASRLQMPKGFHLSVFEDDVDSARMMVFSPGGVLVVTLSDVGKVVALPDPQHTGTAQRVVTVAEKLNEPHGIAFYKGQLYIAENDKVERFDWDEANLKATHPQKIADLPKGGGHSTRTLIFHRDKMYVSAGSSCNACVENDSHRAAVMQFNTDGKGEEIFAKGLRNAVGMALNPKTNSIWVTVNGRDWLGDNLPPDTVDDLGSGGGDFGWPYCYGERIPDPNFTKPGDQRCTSTVPPKIQIQAHSAPLGLAFPSGKMFPPEFQNCVYIALHGSWNRSVPTGYKVVRVKLDDKGQPSGGVEDFISGWMAPGETKKGKRMGRPVGIAFAADGSMYISDDQGGRIYRVTYGK
jgi:glucose/arabinose dehydrogenase